MIIDLQRFLESERSCWTELEQLLDRLEGEGSYRPTLVEARRFHYLYERAAADLGRLNTFAVEPDTRRYLESLVGRAYAEIHESRTRPHRWAPVTWFLNRFPRTVRRHARALALSVGITLAGALLGAAILGLDPQAKAALLPFPHLLMDPAERVAQEEETLQDRLLGSKSTFSTTLMTHNTRVAVFTLALGITWGVGSLILLFYNGVILGAVCFDYLLAGQGKFLAGWLLPHGSVEIPAILIAGQAGLVLAGALLGRGDRRGLPQRLRDVGGDLVTLIGGVAVMLVWAGVVEAFLSQYHEPVLPYALKILFGAVQLGLLVLFLTRSGRGPEPNAP